jgi:hypothetical protein
MSQVWLVVHRNDIKAINPKVIGFWNKRVNYDPISVGDTIIYYRGGHDRQHPGNIEGIYEVMHKCYDIDLRISSKVAQGKGNYLYWQFLLRDKYSITLKKYFLDKHKSVLSFYEEWKAQKWGSENDQIFRSSNDDIKELKNIFNRIPSAQQRKSLTNL